MEKTVLAQILEIVYIILILITIVKIIYDTHNPIKSLAYILFVIFVPFVGMFIYFSIGVNYRKKRFYNRKCIENSDLYKELDQYFKSYTENKILEYPEFYSNNEQVIRMLLFGSSAPLASTSSMKLLLNGENKFPEVLKAMDAAKDHIHIEYFIYNDDEIGNTLKDMMIKKAKEGVYVRFIFDDYGSHVVRKKMMKELRASGIEVYPFYQIRLYALANRMNYRNHRKIVVIDGNVGFIGGINVDNKYINSGKNKLYWRDTHLKIEGNAVSFLQAIFISDWNFCNQSGTDLPIERNYFPIDITLKFQNPVQIAASGPDSKMANIMLSFLGIITGSKQRLYITTPYLIPNETIIDSLKYSALSGVDVRLLVPGISDSRVVNAASCSYYEELLESGVRIYRYQKGFVHAKTTVSDYKLAVIGTANMDIRSFDIMFEANAIVFSEEMNTQLCEAFFNDLNDSVEVHYEEWLKRKKIVRFGDYCARLISPLL